MKYTTINIQGNLISEEILQKVEKGEADGQQAKDFGLEPGANLRSEIEYAWSRIKLDWKYFSDRSQHLPANDSYGTTLSRKWMKQFFSSIGFELSDQKLSLTGDNSKLYNISHTAENIDSLPVHIVGFVQPNNPDKNTLDTKSSGGTSKFSPHAVMQEYLNVTEHVYGIASNGLYLRLIRDSGRLIKLTYVEFDLKRMLDEDKYSEFTLLYRLLHASRFPRNKAEAEQCFLEKYYQDSIETGNRIRDGLSRAVKESLLALGQGFLQHESNTALRQKIQSDQLSAKDYYRQLLRIIYRFLFLMVTEERDLVYDPDDKSDATQKLKKIYLQFYSIARLRKLSESRYVYEEQFSDLWQGLVQSFKLFEAGGIGKKLGIQPLDGDLFSHNAVTDLQSSLISNRLLLECVRNMNEFKDDNKNLVAINYRSLDVEELGSVYEGLLELHPVIENIEATNPAHINFTFHEGTDRKTTGSYYTRPELVNELIKSALIPVIEERLKEHTGNKEAKAKALLKLKVCDAAAGSGHMLLAAARTIAWYLARVQSGEENPAPSLYRKCLREVIQHCIYAVDFNPDAVELCKLALWLEGHNSGKPLSFLDHKIRNGNSLVGVTDLSVLKKGIPDDAFNPVTGDDKKICQELKKENAKYNKTKQTSFDFEGGISIDTSTFTGDYRELENLQQNDVEAVQQVRIKFEKLRTNHNWFNDWRACNLWTAAFFWNYTEENKLAAPTNEKLAKFLKNPAAAYGPMIGKADALSIEHKFFHWPLEFPDVFDQGGFDVMLGNPPWEIVELNVKEFFATSKPDIVNAPNDKLRKSLIESLVTEDPNLFNKFVYQKHSIDAQRKFIQNSNRFPESSGGRIDLYPLFIENLLQLFSKKGMLGIVVPSEISTGAYTANLFSQIVSNKQLTSYYDFENTKGLFSGVDSRKRFCLLTLNGTEIINDEISFFYFAHDVADLLKSENKIKLKISDLQLFSPNTNSAPIFLNEFELELAKKVYGNFGVFINKKNNKNAWSAFINRMFSISDAGVDFKSNFELTSEEKNNLTRVFGGKNIHQYNHRFATAVEKKIKNVAIGELQDCLYKIETETYAPVVERAKRLRDKQPTKFLIGYRGVARGVDERSCIACFLPIVGCDTSCRNIFSTESSVALACLLGNLNSITFDFFARQKLIGANLTSGIFEQLPVLPPQSYDDASVVKILPMLIELTYTSWEMLSLMQEIWTICGMECKIAIKQQHEENKKVAGGHEWIPPQWCEIDEEGCTLPPFKWDEERRAVLKAELDAIYAKLYGLTTEELRYILDPQDVYGPDFPGETFRVLKEKEIRLYGEYRTRRLVLEAWGRLNAKTN